MLLFTIPRSQMWYENFQRVYKNRWKSVPVFRGSSNTNDCERRYKYKRMHQTTWNGLAFLYLASGGNARLLESQFRIGKKTISRIVNDVCQAIFGILGPFYVNTPRNTRKSLEIAQKCIQRWNFPNGVGAIDGKHILKWNCRLIWVPTT